ncbi:PREDICTED: glutathione transferase GST 23-like [Prunus mume]|uniref:Glutathione S-transferase n=1 Tax=Prunus mume TaxID=102107 RepID=A0ABM0NFL3_PRUMU|nr:PREDICTED: glutathione transferase GST 23-like [Prunus mume]
MAEVKLHGFWSSPFSCRVIWALKLKGIPYDYIEEDLQKKSPELLKYNPVHKKIPVLVHGGRPICESMIIVEYIEETWPHKYPFLPTDPYERAMARFWVKYVEEKGPAIWMVSQTTGVEQVKFKKESLEYLRNINDHAGTLGKKKFFGGDHIGILDIALGCIGHWTEVIEDVAGVKLFEAHAFPYLHAWTQNFKEVPAIKENLPDRDKMLVHFKRGRE